jgi:hypothetical protein
MTRIVYGPGGEFRDLEEVSVWTHCTQFDDGSIDDGSAIKAPGVTVSGCVVDSGLSSDDVREFAALLIAAADEIDELEVAR